MADITINEFKIVQGPRELIEGFKYNDLSRISAYKEDLGLHTGSFSPTVGRNGQPFGTTERQTTLF